MYTLFNLERYHNEIAPQASQKYVCQKINYFSVQILVRGRVILHPSPVNSMLIKGMLVKL